MQCRHFHFHASVSKKWPVEYDRVLQGQMKEWIPTHWQQPFIAFHNENKQKIFHSEGWVSSKLLRSLKTATTTTLPLLGNFTEDIVF